MAYDEGLKKGKDFALSPLRFLWKVAGFIIGLALVSFIILIPVSMIFQNNALASYYYDKITSPLINTGFGNFVKQGVSIVETPFSQKKQVELLESYSWKSTIDENSKKQDLGVKITRFQLVNSLLNMDFQKVEGVAEGYASVLNPTIVEFSCLTEDNEKGEMANNADNFKVMPNKKEYFTAKCIFNKELFKINTAKATDSKRVRFKASYDFTTESYIPIYILQEDALDYKIEEGSKGPVKSEYNIFEEYDIQDEHLNKKDGTTESVYTQGPVKFELRSVYSQPYTEDGPFGSGSYYTLGMKINDEISWTGKLERIEEFDLLIPDEISISTDNFDYVNDENNFHVYKARGILIGELNNKCRNKNIRERNINFINEDCWRNEGMETSIEFSVSNAPEELSKTFIRSRVKYKFNDEKQDTVTFITDAS